MKLFTLSVSILFTTSLFAADSVLSLCNHNTDRAVYSAHLKPKTGAGWQSSGWYKVEAGKCTDLNLGTYVGKVFLYAQDELNEATWGGGPVKFCVKQGAAFSFNNADTIPCTEAGQLKVASDEVSVAPGKTTWDIRPNFSQLSLCNRNLDYSVYASIARPVNGKMKSKGWYEVAAGACKTLTFGNYSGPVSYFASHNQLVWDGPAKPVCVNRTLAFEIDDADDATKCTGTGLQMIHPREVNVVTGLTSVDLEAKTAEAVLSVCNETDKELFSSRAISSGDGLWASSGWLKLAPKQCVASNLGGYRGPLHLYAEWNLGEVYWGSGPFNFCVHRTQSFQFSDGANEAMCNSDIAYKMVPSFPMDVKEGNNTFTFHP